MKIMVLQFFESLDSVAEHLEKLENKHFVKYVSRSVGKSFGAASEYA